MKTDCCTDHCICKDLFQQKGLSDTFWLNVPRRRGEGRGLAGTQVDMRSLFREQLAYTFPACWAWPLSSCPAPCSPGAMGSLLGSAQSSQYVHQEAAVSLHPLQGHPSSCSGRSVNAFSVYGSGIPWGKTHWAWFALVWKLLLANWGWKWL